VSGVVVHRLPGEGNDVAAFKLQTRRALGRLRMILEASGTDFQHVVMINSFHVWQGPDFAGKRDGLLGSRGIVEVQLIAKVR
jgi:enamine deaminase RidA (YjgF/YER057c/UK114 family)